jgi:predicted nucleic acid-binding protein
VIVLDASAAVELLGDTTAGRRVLDRMHGERLLHAPHLLDLEVLSAFRRQVALGSTDAERAGRGLDQFRNLRILRHPHHPYFERIWDLRNQFTTYDACYLALTEALGATLLTQDSVLASARLHRGTVELI